MTDPLTLVYNAIVTELDRRKFKVVNYNGLKQPRKDVVSTEDLPEWDVRPSALSIPVIGSASCSTDVTQTYQLVHNTGDLRVGHMLFPENFRMLAAMYHFQYGGLDHLKYNNRSFVQSVAVQSIVQGITDPSGTRGALRGWAAVWNIVVNMSFTSEDFNA